VIIMAISSTGATEKMILWKSLHIEVNRDNHCQASPAATVINTSCCTGAG
jgi:hypothetical protein